MKNNFKNKLTNEKSGFTLIEIFISMSIFIMIVIAVGWFSRNIWVYNSLISTQLGDLENGRVVLKTMVSEIRTASAANNGAYALSQTTASSFTFYSDLNSDGLKEKVRYFLNGTDLQKGVIVPTGSPLSYNSANETITTLIRNVTNPSIFSYYNDTYDGTTAALPTPVDVGSVHLVKITITIDQNPGQAPASSTFSTQVTIRNLKGNL